MRISVQCRVMLPKLLQAFQDVNQYCYSLITVVAPAAAADIKHSRQMPESVFAAILPAASITSLSSTSAGSPTLDWSNQIVVNCPDISLAPQAVVSRCRA